MKFHRSDDLTGIVDDAPKENPGITIGDASTDSMKPKKPNVIGYIEAKEIAEGINSDPNFIRRYPRDPRDTTYADLFIGIRSKMNISPLTAGVFGFTLGSLVTCLIILINLPK